MLSSFTIQNFKSYRKAAAEARAADGPDRRRTRPARATRSRPSVSFPGSSRANKLGAIRYAVQEEDRAIRGTVRDLGFENRHAFSLSCRITHPEWNRYSIELERRDDDELHITDERLTGLHERVPLFEIVALQGWQEGRCALPTTTSHAGAESRR